MNSYGYRITWNDYIQRYGWELYDGAGHTVDRGAFTYITATEAVEGALGRMDALTAKPAADVPTGAPAAITSPVGTPSGNRKTTEGKVPMACLPLDALTSVAWVFRHGEVKYGPENWRQPLPQGNDVEHYVGAALRHLAASQHDRKAQDKESGLSHLDHAIASLIIASYHNKRSAK